MIQKKKKNINANTLDPGQAHKKKTKNTIKIVMIRKGEIRAAVKKNKEEREVEVRIARKNIDEEVGLPNKENSNNHLADSRKEMILNMMA